MKNFEILSKENKYELRISSENTESSTTIVQELTHTELCYLTALLCDKLGKSVYNQTLNNPEKQ